MSSSCGDACLFQVGDPTFLGWLTFVAYLVSALLALRAWYACRFIARVSAYGHEREASLQGRLAVWWLGTGILMILLGLNKELDLLQRLVDQWGRAAARSQGWYEYRKTVQIIFVASLMLLSAGALAGILHYLREVRARIALAMVGVALIVGYAVLRAAVFHVLRDVAPAVADSLWGLELLGAALITWCAARPSRGRRT